MTLTIPDDVRAKAEVYEGDAAGQEKTRLLLQEAGLPSGLLPLRDIIECGYVEETGFVWLRQRRKVDHYFARAGRHVSYAAEVSAVAEKGRLKKITGVKAKEMLIWVTLHEIFVDEPCSGKLHVKAMGGFSRSFPVEAFQAEGPPPVFTPRNIPAHRKAAAVEAAKAVQANGGTKDATEVPPKVVEQGKEVEGEEEAKKSEAAGEEGEKKGEPAAAAEGEEGKKEAEAAAAVDKVEEKLKELGTEQAVVQAEAVAAKN